MRYLLPLASLFLIACDSKYTIISCYTGEGMDQICEPIRPSYPSLATCKKGLESYEQSSTWSATCERMSVDPVDVE